MSDDFLAKLRERKNQLDRELTQKVSKDYNDLMGKVNENIQSLRQGSKDFYAQKAQQELDKWEQAIKSGNTINAVSHKMMAETYLALAKTL
jgi:paraquat-inducible protein B